MSLSQLIVFIIGVVLALFGLWIVITGYTEIVRLIIGLVLIVVGVALLIHKSVTL